VIWASWQRWVAQVKEETMPDLSSAVSRVLRLFSALPPVDEKAERQREDDRTPAAEELERKHYERDEAFFWTWQYPGQW
jgi:hypothetical protein